MCGWLVGLFEIFIQVLTPQIQTNAVIYSRDLIFLDFFICGTTSLGACTWPLNKSTDILRLQKPIIVAVQIHTAQVKYWTYLQTVKIHTTHHIHMYVNCQFIKQRTRQVTGSCYNAQLIFYSVQLNEPQVNGKTAKPLMPLYLSYNIFTSLTYFTNVQLHNITQYWFTAISRKQNQAKKSIWTTQ